MTTLSVLINRNWYTLDGKYRQPVLVVILALLLLTVSDDVLAQDNASQVSEDPARQVHWAMGDFFGTGWYRVSNNRSVYIIRVPPSQTIRNSSIDDKGMRTLGFYVQYPLSFGLQKLDDFSDITDFDNYTTFSFTPGVQFEIPLTKQWYLRPYANLGWGKELNDADSAWIYYGGLKSRYSLGGGESRWSLLNSINFAGYKPEYEKRGRYGSAMTGVEFDHPLKGIALGQDDAWLNGHLTYSYLFDKINFHVSEDRLESINDQWEIGFALGKGKKKMKLWFLSFEQVGLSFKWSSNGVYKAISLNMHSPFTN